jgi:hypothetical protein
VVEIMQITLTVEEKIMEKKRQIKLADAKTEIN